MTSPRNLTTLVSEVLQEAITPVHLARLATEILAHKAADTATELFAILRRKPSEIALKNVFPLLAELARRDDRWRRLVRKSLTKSGRCPRPFRNMLRSELAADNMQSRSTPRALLLRDIDAPARRTTELTVEPKSSRIRLTTVSTDIIGISGLINALEKCLGARSLILDVRDVDHLYVVGLTLLATWCRSRQVSLRIENATASTSRYLDRMGLLKAPAFSVLQTTQGDGWSVAISPLDVEPPEILGGRIVDICVEQGFVGKTSHNALIIAFAEMIENVHRHAGAKSHALASAQFYPARKKLTIVVADAGMGIRESFQSGTNSVAQQRILAGENPLDLALSPLITSKPIRSHDQPGHAGYGLYVVSELCVRNGGTFRLTSGNSSLVRFRKYYQESWTRKSSQETHANWQGTVAAMILDLDNLLPIGEVYATLPLPEGYEEEDFFRE